MGHTLTRMLRAGMPPGWTSAERVVALVLADVCNDDTRRGWISNEHLCEEAGLTPNGLSDVLRKLARDDFDVRVPHGTGKDGRPVYATRGHSTDYRMPLLPPRPDAKAPSSRDLIKAPPSRGLSIKAPSPRPKGPVRTGKRSREDGPPTPENPRKNPFTMDDAGPQRAGSREEPSRNTAKCEWCGIPFIGRVGATYCSSAHRQAAYRERRAASW